MCYLLGDFEEGNLADEHEVDAAACGPKVNTFCVHLPLLEDLRSSVDGRAHFR